jgi:endonuclease-3
MDRTERTRQTLEALRTVIPRPETELSHTDPYQLIVAVILSAQCTDARVNQVTPALFAAFPTLEALAAAPPEAVFPYIRSVSYPNNKARHLVGMAQQVMAEHGGQVPADLDALMRLPGVGRKTAQVVASVAFAVEALPVDTHVFRVANRIGLTEHADTVLKVEQQLKALTPPNQWGETHHLLILHGRYTCAARQPHCDRCVVAPCCRYFERLQALPPPLPGLDPKRGRYYSPADDLYFNDPITVTDADGVGQLACPTSGTTDVYETRTGRTTRKVLDFRV